MIHWLIHILGADNGSGEIYLLWSGFGSDIAEFAIVGSLIGFYRHHTCHVNHPRYCWRPGTHPVAGTPLKACRKHHPDVPEKITVEHIAEVHARQQRGEP